MNSGLDQLADRHFRPDPQGLLAPPHAARQGNVLIGIDPSTATIKPGQDTLWILANMLCRQFRLVTAIGLDIPAGINLLPGVAAFGTAPQLLDTIVNGIRLVAGPHVEAAKFDSAAGAKFDFEIMIGRPTMEARAPIRLVLFADGWRFYVGTGWPAVRNERPQSSATLGPYMAACFAAAEVFKRLRGMKQGKGNFIDAAHPLLLSLWSGSSAHTWGALDAGPDIEGITLPPLYFAGAGAVGQSAALTLGGVPRISGHVTAVDPDNLDLTNGNRYPLATLENDREPKAPLLAGFLQDRGFTTFAYPGHWQAYVTGQGREANRSDLAELERRYLYRFILSCVDDNGARYALQNLWPDMLIGGSTHGLTAKAIVYDMAAKQLCLKCFNPVVERNDIVRDRLEEARRMSPEERFGFFTSLGLDPARAEAHLRDPGCGQLSERDLDRFAAGAPIMSVGFVSVAAGVLLAAQTLRAILVQRPSLMIPGANLMANFYKPGLRWLSSLPQQGCDCIERRASDWVPRWNPSDAKADSRSEKRGAR
jgi:molybdopterin/thiamine biosynthesis adenylyltransferase